jgi:LPS-assembly protein
MKRALTGRFRKTFSFLRNNKAPILFFAPGVFGFFPILLICLFFTNPALAGGKKYDIEIKADPLHPWQMKANEVSYDSKTKEYRASGNVVIQHVEKTLEADTIVFNAQTMDALALGHVKLTIAGDVLTAESMDLNLAAEKGVLKDSRIFLEENHLYIRGKRIEKSDAFTYVVEDAEVTSCDGEDPDWRVTGKKVKVTLDEYATVNHGRLWAGDVPVFYTPFFIFPVKLHRQTGLLIPNFGFSQRKGFELDLPLFWAINDHSDATVYGHSMSMRGNKLGMEYRYLLDGNSRGTFKIDYLNDREVDDGTLKAADEWGFDHDDYTRPNEKRFWARLKADHDLPSGFMGKLDLDLVSDQDYLIEFRDGYSGYNQTRDEFRKDYSRILDAYEDPVRINQVNLNKKGAGYSWNNTLKWYDNVIARRYLDENRTLQNLPRIQFDMLKQQVSRMPVYYSLNSDYTYFFSQDGASGNRMDLYPRLYTPLFSSPYLTVESFLGARETLWHMNQFEKDPSETGKEETSLRHMVDFNLNFRSEGFRVYDLKSGSFDRVKHVISPEIIYTYIPHVNQEEYPSMDGLLDGINRIEDTNQISFFFTQYLTLKKDPVVPAKNPENLKPETLLPAYRQAMRFSLEQTFDIQEARAEKPSEYRNEKSKQPFLPLTADLELIPSDYFSIWAATSWSYYENTLVENNIELSLRNHRSDRLDLSYRFTEDALETFGARSIVQLYRGFSVFGSFEHNLRNNENIETGGGFDYDTQCWSFELEYSDKEDDKKVEFFINLKGLG